MESMKRRTFLASSAAFAAAIGLNSRSFGQAAETPAAEDKSSHRPNHIAVSTYSFWRFKDNLKLPIEDCIDQAAEMGFDGVDILHIQMEGDSNTYLQNLKRRALINGLDLCCMSTHQSFVKPDKEKRQENIDHTIKCIEIANALGIPIIRINTGRWGTTRSFDDLMANRGIEPVLPGYTEDQGFEWVIESIEKCLPVAEKNGVILGLENHWGLSRTPEGLMRIVNAIESPWLQVLLDTGNFLEEPYEKLEQCIKGRLHAGQDLLWRRYLVHARFGLSPYRRDNAQAQLSGLYLARIRGQRGLQNSDSQKPCNASKCLCLIR